MLYLRSTTLKIGPEIAWSEIVAPAVRAVTLQAIATEIFYPILDASACRSEAKDLEAGNLFATVKEQFDKEKEILQRLSKSRVAGRG